MIDRSKRTVFVAVVAVVSMLGGVAWGSSWRTSAFPDVPPNAFYSAAVQWAKDNGITSGVGDTGLFQPEANVTRGQMATFLQRLNDLLVGKISAAESASLPRDAIVVNVPTSLAVLHPASGSADFESYAARVTALGNVILTLGLPGPQSFGTVDYTLQSVEYCVEGGSSTAQLDYVILYGQPAGSSPAGVDLGRTDTNLTDQCATVSPDQEAKNPELLMGFGVSASYIELTSVTATWVPVDEFVPASVDLGPASTDASQING